MHIRMSKRAELPLYKSILIRAIAILLSLVVCSILIVVVTKENPLAVYKTMVGGVFGTNRRLWAWLRDLAMLLCIAIGLAPAFKMKFWNIGAEGQILAGGIGASAVMIYLGNAGLPNTVLLLLMALAALIVGGIWGFIPGFFKAKLNTNETLFTLMMNYIALQFIAFFMPIWEHPAGSNTVGIINSATQAGWFPAIAGKQFMLNVLIVGALVILMYVYLKYSKQGYEIAVVGESENTAKYVGMNVPKIIVRTMLISGAICGLAGFIAVAGSDHTISADTSGGRGFVAIIVAWLSKFNTFVMVLMAAMIIFFDKAAIAIASEYRLNNDFSNVITDIILFFILGSEFFITYKLHFSKNEKEDK